MDFAYENEHHFLLLNDMVDEGIVVSEGVPVGYLDSLDGRDSFIDIGAHHGMYSLIVGKCYDDLSIYSFEPGEFNREILTELLEVNDVEATVRPEVVSGSTGEITFYERKDEESEGHSTTPYRGATKTVKRSVALSDFFEDEGIEDPFLKVDAEGEEYDILSDVFTCGSLESVNGLVEIHPDKSAYDTEDILDLFREQGLNWEDATEGERSASRPMYHFWGENQPR